MKKPVLLGAVLLLAALSASDADEEHCTDSESCSEPAESIWSWLPQSWDIFSILEKIEKTIMYNINKKAQELYEDFARSMQSWEIFSTIQKILTNVKDTIAHNAKVVYEKLEDFADRVRNVFREEFGSFLEVLWERALGIAPESDSMFWRFKAAVEHKLLTLGLIILCLIINYFTSLISFHIGICNAIIWILLFNSSVLLIYKFMGPKWVYYIFGTVVWYTWDILSYLWTYPYISAGAIFVVFVGSIAWSIYWICRRIRRENMQTDMLVKSNATLEKMENINARLEEMENNINATLEKMENINDRLQKMEKKQDEILRLLNRSARS